MTSNNIQRTMVWIILVMSVATDVEAEAYEDSEIFYQVKQGIRSQRKAFKRSRVMTALDCVLSCFGEKTCKSFNYAEPTSVNEGEGNCELHNDTKNDDDNSLQFLKDDRYTFYQIPGASHESENKQTTENATEQANKPASNKSCLDHFNHGSKTSGNYTIFDSQQKPRTVYCDMESEPGSVWTLVMSFTRANKEREPFRFSGMYEDAPANKYSPNWSNYRMSLNQMTDLKNKTTHWRATCSFPTYRFDIHTDYVRAVFTDFDLMGKFSGECKKANYISVMKQSCSECTSNWWQSNSHTPHIYAGVNNSPCDVKSDKSDKVYFGAYYRYSTAFRCTATSDSTTNYWFGSNV